MLRPFTPDQLRNTAIAGLGLVAVSLGAWGVLNTLKRETTPLDAAQHQQHAGTHDIASTSISSLLAEEPRPYIFAQSLPLEGPASHLGRSYSRGLDAALRALNAAGGINGRPVRIWRLDDGYEPANTIRNTALFTQHPEVLGLFGYVGTPTTKAVLAQAEAANLTLIAPMTGASSLRQPGQNLVVHFRASYAQEANRIINHLVNDGYVRIAIAYQNDAYGQDVLTSLLAALKGHGLTAASTAKLPRNSTNIHDAATELSRSNPDALVVISTSKTMAALVDRLHHMGQSPQLMTISFTGTKALFSDLPQRASFGIGVTQVVPFPWDRRHPEVKRYQQVLHQQSDQPDFDFISLEGFLIGEWLGETLQSLGANITRQSLVKALKATSPVNQDDNSVDLVFLGSGPWEP